jgi:hypothetical protein
MSKKQPSPSGDRHKPNRLARVRKVLADQAEILAGRLVIDFTDVVNLAVRELLERHGLWPPSPGERHERS